MDYKLFSDVVVVRDIPQHQLRSGDIGTVVERHDIAGKETGYSVEFFDALRKTIAVVTLPVSQLRLPQHTDIPAVRPSSKVVAS